MADGLGRMEQSQHLNHADGLRWVSFFQMKEWACTSMLFGLLVIYAGTSNAGSVLQGSLPRSSVYPFVLRPVRPQDLLVEVQAVEANSAPAKAGLQHGDVIRRINGHSYDSPADAERALWRAPGGRAVELEVERKGRSHRVRFVAAAAPLESIAGVDSTYDVLVTRDGARLRTIVTRPQGQSEPLPAIYFVQWLSCDSIERPLNPLDHGWQRMIELVASRTGLVMMRTEKAGIGDSEGPSCSQLDYDTELDHHRDSLDRLRKFDFVDARRVVVFGASMGGNMAVLLASEQPVAGLIIWGTAIESWFEHLVRFNRRYLELSGRPPADIAPSVDRQIGYLSEYVLRGKSPQQISTERPELASIWREIRGMSERTHYGRPFAFHHQAQRKNWLGALGKIHVQTLALYGEYDWFEKREDHALIAEMVNRNNPGAARFVTIPGMDHHFSIYPSAADAFNRAHGLVAPEAVVLEIASWLRSLFAEEAGTTR